MNKIREVQYGSLALFNNPLRATDKKKPTRYDINFFQ